MKYDVIVTGAGFAGLSAAYMAVREGQRAAVVARGAGNCASSSGAFELLGFLHGQSEPVTNPLESLDTLTSSSKAHPYALMGKEWVCQAAALFKEMTEEIGIAYRGTPEENILVPTAIGVLQPLCMMPEMSYHSVLQKDTILAVGIEELHDFFPTLLSKTLGQRLSRQIPVQRLRLGVESGRGLNSFDCAHLLEKAEIRKAIIEQMKDNIANPKDLILFPAVLGFHHHHEVRRHLEEALRSPILEIATLPPVMTACRLADRLRAWLLNRGVDFYDGAAAHLHRKEEGGCTELSLTFTGKRSRVLNGSSFVLATGGILGEGLIIHPDSVKETVFDLPVPFQKPWTLPDFLDTGGQPMTRAGVRVNSNLQPLDSTGGVIFQNVFVAGGTLAGYDPYMEKSGTGVAFCSGFRAGRMASGKKVSCG